MKKLLLVSLAIFTVMTVYSQTGKGKMFIGGQFNLIGNTVSDLDTLHKSDLKLLGFQIVPSFGYFIKDNIAIGVNVNFGISNITQNYEYPNQMPSKTTYKSNSINYGIGGFTRYYKKIVANFYFFVNGGISYMYQTRKLENSNNDPNYVYPTSNPANQKEQTNYFSVAISPGLVYFITPKLGIQAAFGNINYSYSITKNKSLLFDNHRTANSYGINLNISTFNLGLNYYF